MTPDDARRTHQNTTLLIACAVAALGALVGLAADGWALAAFVGVMSGGGALVGGYLVRRPAVAAMTLSEEQGAVRGYADGLSHGVLAAITKYEAAVFPMTAGGTTEDERLARRAAAYQQVAEGALPREIREAAAAAMAALDDGGLRASQDAISNLHFAVRQQMAGR